MEKLKAEHIAAYLPYRLKVIADNDMTHIYDLTNVSLFQGIFKFGTCQQINDDFFEEDDIYLHNIIPILRPISDLIKQLKDGRISLVELAKIAFPHHKWELWNDIAVNKDDIGFIKNKFSYVCSEDYFMHTFKDGGCVKNLSKLYDYLNEHFFDYRGLIGRSLAIDVNTLDENPYE